MEAEGNLLPGQRVIRVFISSTFRDMQEERDYLAKFIFPQLRKLCEERFVIWGEVDLRWGITDEQKSEGRVLPICLEEIRRCRPYFIGLLGERYGWIPDEIPQELIEREPWLKEHLSRSVTELEILHGVLNNPEMAEHAFFYFRDPGYIETIPVDRRQDFLSENQELANKLKRLKDRIRQSKFPVRENYSDPKELGELVLKDITELIDKLYPKGSEPSLLERERLDHNAFARSRARVYIGRDEYFDILDKHVESDGPPLVILGEPGCGKSALIANWVNRYQKEIEEEAEPVPRHSIFSRVIRRAVEKKPLLIFHFIGASPYSADWQAMLRRIMGELKEHLGIQEEIPNKPDELRDAFSLWLNIASARRKIILILDGLNQIEDRDAAPDLVWLPKRIPVNIRLILSTLPGRPLEEIKRRNWSSLTISALEQQERKELIVQYLSQYRKALSEHQLNLIATRSQSANPLYLRILLEELRVFGSYELLDKAINFYLEAKDVSELYKRVLERWENDY